MFNTIILIISNTILIVVFILIGGVIPLIERKYLSLIQRRIGPKFVGYKGRLQFLADALKVVLKEHIILKNTNNSFFILVPVLLLNINILLISNIVWIGNIFVLDIELNLLLLVVVELITNVLIILIGFLLKNKYTIIASNRLINLVFTTEIFIITIMNFILIMHSSFSFEKLLYFKQADLSAGRLLCVLPLVLLFILIVIGKAPFDLIEAETELIMGYHVEYSSFLFGAFVLIEYFHMYVYIYILYTLV